MISEIFTEFESRFIKQKQYMSLFYSSILSNFYLPFIFILAFNSLFKNGKAIHFVYVLLLSALFFNLFYLINNHFIKKGKNAVLHIKVFSLLFTLYFFLSYYFIGVKPFSLYFNILIASLVFPFWSYVKQFTQSIQIPGFIVKTRIVLHTSVFDFILSTISLILIFLWSLFFKFTTLIWFFGGLLLLHEIFFIVKKKFIEYKVPKNKEVNKVDKLLTSKLFFIYILISGATVTILFFLVHVLWSFQVFLIKETLVQTKMLTNTFVLIFLFISIVNFIGEAYTKKVISNLGILLSLLIYPSAILFFGFILLFVFYTIGLENQLAYFFISMLLIMEHTSRNLNYKEVLSSLLFSLNKNIGERWQSVLILFFELSFILVSVFLMWLTSIYATNLKLEYEIIIWIIIGVAVINLFINYRMYRQSRLEMVNVANYKKLFLIDDYDADIYGIDILARRLNSENIEEVKLSTIILSEVNPRMLEPFLPVLFRHKNKIVNRAILRNVDMSFDAEIVNLIEQFIDYENDKELKKYYLLIKSFYNEEDVQNSGKEFAEYAKIQILKKVKEKPYLLNRRFIVKLDKEDELIIRSLIGVISKTNNYHSIDYLTHWITHEKYMHYIADFLVEIGDDILGLLENYFYQQDIDNELLIKIIEIYGRVGSDYAIELLFNHINYPNLYLQKLTINTLNTLNKDYKDKKDIIIRKIYFIVQTITLLLTYRQNFKKDEKTYAILPNIDSEIKSDFSFLMGLLKLIYPHNIITLVEDNIKKKNFLYASEIMHSVLDVELKNVILPLIESGPSYKIIRKLNIYFAIESVSVEEQLKRLIKTNSGKVSNTTRAKAIVVLAGFYRKVKFNKWMLNNGTFVELDWTEEDINNTLNIISVTNIPDELYLGIFHSEPLVYTTAATILYNINPSRTSFFLSKFDAPRRNLLASLRNVDENQEATFLEKLRYLKKIHAFSGVSDEILSHLVNFTRVKDIREDDKWEWEKAPNDDIVLVYNGIFKLQNEIDKNTLFTRNDILIKGLNVPDEDTVLIANKSGKLLIIDRVRYFRTLASHEELLRHIFKNHLGVNI